MAHSSSSFVSTFGLMGIKALFVCLVSVRANVTNLSAPLSISFLFLILNANYAADFICNDVCEAMKEQGGKPLCNRSSPEMKGPILCSDIFIRKTFQKRDFIILC